MNGGSESSGFEDDSEGAYDDPFLYSFFGNAAPRYAPPQPRKSATSRVKVAVTLEDLYLRKTKRVEVTKSKPCGACRGTGAKPTAVARACAACHASGVTYAATYHGSFLSRTRVTCTACEGKGARYRSQDACKKCQGKKVHASKNVVAFESTLENMARTVILLGEGDQEPGKEAGDIEVTLKLRDHPTFKWINKADLTTTVHMTLSESLFGLDRVIVNTLDGRALRTRLPTPDEPGWTCLQTGDEIVIPKEGLSDAQGRKGDLICRVVVNETTKEEAQRLYKEHASVFPAGREDFGGGKSVGNRVKKRAREESD